MKIAVIGATGFVGSKIIQELVDRDFMVVGICRSSNSSLHTNLEYIKADVNDEALLTEKLKDVDVVVSAFNAGWQNQNIYDDYLKGAKVIQKAVKNAKVKRFIVIGGAGSLYVAKDLQAVDTPDFPPAIYGGAAAARDYLNILKDEKELDWTFFSPAFEMHPGINIGRTGKYRLGKDEPIFDESGHSVLSVEDVAVVIADEIEKPQHLRMRFTAAY